MAFFSAMLNQLTRFHFTYVNPYCITFPSDRSFGSSHLGFPCGFRSTRYSLSSIVSRKRGMQVDISATNPGPYPCATNMWIQKETKIQPRNGVEERKLCKPGKS